MESFPAPGRRRRSSALRVVSATTRNPATIRRPRGFAKGAATGILTLLPAVAVGVFALAAAGMGDRRPAMIETLRLTALFAGIPAILTAGGLGRLAAQASLDGGRPRATWVAARAAAFAGGALIVIAAVANQVIPSDRVGWIVLVATGGVAGALSGALVGLACGGPMPSLSELGVWPGSEINLGDAVERVMERARGRRRDTIAPPPEKPPTP